MISENNDSAKKFKQITLDEANRFVNQYHRHNEKVIGHKFSIGLFQNDELIGVGICGRPVARMLDKGSSIEITRVCVKDGHKNACSKIYGRLRRICQLFGYDKIYTYTLERESQSSLKAIGAIQEPMSKPHVWGCKSRRREDKPISHEKKIRWCLA